jgi:hypothetical protein
LRFGFYDLEFSVKSGTGRNFGRIKAEVFVEPPKKPRDFTRLTQTFLQAKSFTKKPICFSFSTGFLFVKKS